MSVDGWKVCPKCREKIQAAKDKEILKASESYGKVDKDEYLELIKKANEKPFFAESLREDYRFYLDDEYTLSIEYACSCEICGFMFHFKKEIDITKSPEAA